MILRNLFTVILIPLAIMLTFDVIRNIYDKWYIRKMKHEWEQNYKYKKYR